MNSLFWKILISFWLALILFVGLTLWSTSHYLQKVRTETGQTHPRYQISQYIQQAREIYHSQGKEGLYEWINELDKREVVPYLLVDQNGNDIVNRHVPLHIKQRINRHYRRLQHEEQHDEQDGDDKKFNYERHKARSIIIDNNTYHLIPDFQNVTLTRVLHRPKVIAIPFFLAALISGIVCFLLARYLTKPISQLRAATRKIAKGDLSQRVSPLLGNRKDELRDLACDFDVMAEQLNKMIIAHKQLLRDASHELRSPLARLQVALGLARQKNTSGSTDEFDRIELEIERLNDLIGQLLSLARLENDAEKTKFTTIDLHALLEKLCEDARFEASANQRNVVFSGDTDVSVSANPALLHSAFENIIRNAIRYTQVNSQVEVSLDVIDNNQDTAEIKVQDHGPGIPEDMLKHVFDPFVRVSEARDRQSGGYGLGLAIASRAIHLHGGHISARNESDGGMSIIVSLPMARNP